MSIINDATKQQFKDAVNNFLQSFMRSPSTTMAGFAAALGWLLTEAATPGSKWHHTGAVLAGIGSALTGVMAASHGFVNKQTAGNTQTFTKPPTSPTPP